MSENRLKPPALVVIPASSHRRKGAEPLAEGISGRSRQAALAAAISGGMDLPPVVSRFARSLCRSMPPEVADLPSVKRLNLLSRLALDLEVRDWARSLLGEMSSSRSPGDVHVSLVRAIGSVSEGFVERLHEDESYIQGLSRPLCL